MTVSQFLTERWAEEMRANIPKCPACAGEVEYGFLVSEQPIRWANDYEGTRFVGIEEPMTWEPKKPLGIPMTRCHKCGIMITLSPHK
ncbi:MAG: PF20097 family protein [Candidatus Thermoplasmatota archaeon]|nr:PF20097 family protein [Candidatus Thermoplasmatota archaeon]